MMREFWEEEEGVNDEGVLGGGGGSLKNVGQMMREFWEEEEEGVNDEGVLGGGRGS